MEIVTNDWHSIILAMFGGIIMGTVMFKYLPGMKSNAYTPREWTPVGVLLVVIAWLTFFAPQLFYSSGFDITTDDFVKTWWGVGVAYTIYAAFTTGTLLVFQYARNRKSN